MATNTHTTHMQTTNWLQTHTTLVCMHAGSNLACQQPVTIVLMAPHWGGSNSPLTNALSDDRKLVDELLLKCLRSNLCLLKKNLDFYRFGSLARSRDLGDCKQIQTTTGAANCTESHKAPSLASLKSFQFGTSWISCYIWKQYILIPLLSILMTILILSFGGFPYGNPILG